MNWLNFRCRLLKSVRGTDLRTPPTQNEVYQVNKEIASSECVQLLEAVQISARTSSVLLSALCCSEQTPNFHLCLFCYERLQVCEVYPNQEFSGFDATSKVASRFVPLQCFAYVSTLADGSLQGPDFTVDFVQLVYLLLKEILKSYGRNCRETRVK